MSSLLRAFTHVMADTLDSLLNGFAAGRHDRRARHALGMNRPIVFEIISRDSCMLAGTAVQNNCAIPDCVACQVAS